MNFYNRDEERNTILKLLKKIDENQNIAICLEGPSGVGKTYLMKYVIKKNDKYTFLYNDVDLVYKCTKSNSDKEFSYISTILATLQIRYPDAFNSCIIDYFDTINVTSIREGLALLIPEIPGLNFTDKILSNSLENVASPKKHIGNVLLNRHLIRCFSEIISTLIKEQKIIFCIDDIVWIDNMSLEVLKLLVNSKNNYCISLFLTMRRYNDFESSEEKTRYQEIVDDLINDNFQKENTAIIPIYNFDYALLKKIIKETNNTLILQNMDLFYKITNGNPLEVVNTQKFSDIELKNKFNKYINSNSNQENHQFLTTELNISLLSENYYNTCILVSLSLVDNEIDYNLLSIISREIYQKYYDSIFEESKFNIQFNKLKDDGILKGKNRIMISHDSTAEIVNNYIKATGEYIEFIDILTSVLFSLKNTDLTYCTIILRLLSETNAKKGFDYFKQMVISSTYNIEIIKYASKCFCAYKENWTSKNIEEYGVELLFKELFLNGILEDAAFLGNCLYKMIMKCSDKIKYKFIVMYTKILIDLGKYCSDDAESANSIFNELYKLDNLDINQQLEILLIEMSLYEHQGLLKKINECFSKAEELIDNNLNINSSLRAVFYRNKGLTEFHANLENDYLKAISISETIQEQNHKNLMLGTSYNNLGLCKFYSGEIKKADENFKNAIKFIELTGYETVRSLNNRACCAFAHHNYKKSLYFLKEALDIPFKGKFEIASVRLNLALVLYMLDDKKSALDILDGFISEYESKKTEQKDGWIYSNAYLNRGYIKYSEGEYLEACKDYKNSNFYKSRFQAEQEYNRRKALEKYCLIKEGLLDNNISYEIDYNGTNFDFYNTPYILSLLAYYVI